MGVGEVDGVVADLGLSSLQLEEAERGFAFSQDGPLDMRFDRSRGADGGGAREHAGRGVPRRSSSTSTAKSVAPAPIARRIVARRPIQTTGDLRARSSPCWVRNGDGIDPATRTFQALRIAVNRELDALGALLAQAPQRPSTGGRLVVVSYHSLEDREVKHAFRELARRDADEPGRAFTL